MSPNIDEVTRTGILAHIIPSSGKRVFDEDTKFDPNVDDGRKGRPNLSYDEN